MKIDHFENLPPTQSTMEDEACERLPSWNMQQGESPLKEKSVASNGDTCSSAIQVSEEGHSTKLSSPSSENIAKCKLNSELAKNSADEHSDEHRCDNSVPVNGFIEDKLAIVESTNVIGKDNESIDLLSKTYQGESKICIETTREEDKIATSESLPKAVENESDNEVKTSESPDALQDTEASAHVEILNHRQDAEQSNIKCELECLELSTPALSQTLSSEDSSLIENGSAEKQQKTTPETISDGSLNDICFGSDSEMVAHFLSTRKRMGRPKKVKRVPARKTIPDPPPAGKKKLGRPRKVNNEDVVVKEEKESTNADTVEGSSDENMSVGSPKRKTGNSPWCLKRLKTDLKINDDEPPVLGKRSIVRPMYTEKFKFMRAEPQIKSNEETVAKKKLGRPKKILSDDSRSPVKIEKGRKCVEPEKIKREAVTPKKLGRPRKVENSPNQSLSVKKKLFLSKRMASGEVTNRKRKLIVNESSTCAKKLKLDESRDTSENGTPNPEKSFVERTKMKPGRKPNGDKSPCRSLKGSPDGTRKKNINRIDLKLAEVKVEDCLTNLFISKKCKFCNKTFESRNKFLMRRHLASVHGIEPFCKRCSAIFKNKDDLSLHMKTCTALHNNKNKRLARQDRLQNKLLVAAIRQERLRKIQNKIREKLKSLDPPSVEFDESMSTVCPYCSKTIPFKYNLKRHIHTFHPDKELFVENSVLYTCPYCHKIISNKFNLQRHMTVMHRDEVFCKYCWELFNKQSELNGHVPKCLDGPHFNRKRRKWDCPWESKTIEKNMVKYETSCDEEEKCPAESPPDDGVECDKLKETLYGNVSNQEVACDDSEFYTPLNNDSSLDSGFVISEIVEIYTTDENSSDLLGDNAINISADAIAVSSDFVFNLQKSIQMLKNEDWDAMTDSSLDESSMDLNLPVLTLKSPSLHESDSDIQPLPVLTLKSPPSDESHQDESAEKVYQVL